MSVTAPDPSGPTTPTDTAVLHLRGDVDALSQGGYRDDADALLTASVQRLVVDLAAVETMDSSGLGLLVHLHTAARERDIAMVLTNVPPRATALLARTGLDHVFVVDDTVEG